MASLASIRVAGRDDGRVAQVTTVPISEVGGPGSVCLRPWSCPSYGASCLDAPGTGPAGAPGPAPGVVARPLGAASQVVLLTSGRPGWRQLQDRPLHRPGPGRPGGGTDQLGGPYDHGDGADLAGPGMPPAAHGIVGLQVRRGRPERHGGAQCAALEHPVGRRPVVLPALGRSSPGPPSGAARCPSSAGRTFPAAASARLTSTGARERELGRPSSMPVLVRRLLARGESPWSTPTTRGSTRSPTPRG